VCIARYLHSSELEASKQKGQAQPQQAHRPVSSWEASAERTQWCLWLDLVTPSSSKFGR